MFHYDLTDLRVFLAVAEEGNLTRGAARVHLAPSSVSLRIKALEDTIGAPLLTRQARGVGITPAGQVLLEHCRRCLAHLEQMHADLLPFGNGLPSHVTLFANNNAISSFLPDDLSRFFQAHPNARVTLEERMSHDIIGAVAAGRADIGIVAVDAPRHTDLEFIPYRDDELIILAPLGTELSRQKSAHFSACLKQPFISLRHGAALHTFLMNHATALGGRLDVMVQVSGYRAIARLVASGAGIGIVPRSALQPDDLSELAAVTIDEPWSMRHLHICIQRDPVVPNIIRDHLVALLADAGKV
ncbi:LysR family transcriptional regulator [Cupriavidus sp. USMAA2-4]|uniref:LysR substrate-binding domain-containing protein n=1 Tax=Cupriavidus sp. USMAA2-4 TaxID=876364 RepID=UPI0008A7047E|nr:LysR substrate-binding domain-containing protein [Cupriavidus sp. USMAA2-4]AOY96136.1 LysR family transcriptional regulator [Cupriavidus sp. USMAA2-4]